MSPSSFKYTPGYLTSILCQKSNTAAPKNHYLCTESHIIHLHGVGILEYLVATILLSQTAVISTPFSV